MALIKKKELISSLERAAICIAKTIEKIEVAGMVRLGHVSYHLDATRISRFNIVECDNSLKQIDTFRPKETEDKSP